MTEDVASRLPDGWAKESGHRFVGSESAPNQCGLILDRDEELDAWSYNLYVKPAKAKAAREFIGDFQQGQADEFLDSLREVPAADELDGVPKLFTGRGLRITWFRGQQGSETFEPERG